MAASDHLSPPQFFHGSTHHFRRGQVIDPTDPHPTNFESSEADKLYFDTRHAKAVEYAGLQDEGSYRGDTYRGPGTYRSVYTVEPLEGHQPDARRNDSTNYDPDDHSTAFETSGKVRVTGKHIVTDKELYG